MVRLSSLESPNATLKALGIFAGFMVRRDFEKEGETLPQGTVL